MLSLDSTTKKVSILESGWELLACVGRDGGQGGAAQGCSWCCNRPPSDPAGNSHCSQKCLTILNKTQMIQRSCKYRDFVLFAPSFHLSNLSNSRLAVGGVSVTCWPSAASACFLNEKVERQVCGVRNHMINVLRWLNGLSTPPTLDKNGSHARGWRNMLLRRRMRDF